MIHTLYLSHSFVSSFGKCEGKVDKRKQKVTYILGWFYARHNACRNMLYVFILLTFCYGHISMADGGSYVSFSGGFVLLDEPLWI